MTEHQYLVQLRQILEAYFDDGELRTLCFDLQLDYDSLPGQGKASKARELVAYLERRDRIAELTQLGRQLRPQVDWGEIGASSERPPDEGLPAGSGTLVGRVNADKVVIAQEIHKLEM